MIEKPTVLVLGAGASFAYGFPLGSTFYQQIIAETDENEQLHRILQTSGFQLDQIAAFREALVKSGALSIDQFLEHRTDFIPIGKDAIAATIGRLERPENLFTFTENWYRYLFEKMNCPFDQFCENKLRIITFNYDRSLEEFLLEAMLNLHNKGQEATAEIVKKIPVVHVHGSLGPLPWQQVNGRPYVPIRVPSDIRGYSDSIKVIHEGADGANLSTACDWLSNAGHIVFLGFGYHPINMQRLFGPKGSALKAGTLIQGSFFGFKELEQKTITKSFGRLGSRI